MNENEWRAERDSRTIRYAGRRLAPNRWITVIGEPNYMETYAGQVAAITLVNLLSRMTPSVALSLPSIAMVEPLPWSGKSLPDSLLEHAYAVDPYGHFSNTTQPDSHVIRIGGEGENVAHGSGWSSYVGRGPSPIKDIETMNPFGAALAAILACAHIFISDFGSMHRPSLFNSLTWSAEIANEPEESLLALPLADLGSTWAVGVGSVGTAILYFLTLLTRKLSTVLIDPDKVRVHNLDRSPVFVDSDVGRDKVAVVRAYLRSVGVQDVLTESAALHETSLWRNRGHGTPDLLLSAANEHDVRYHIEASWPPVQLYGTTGRNWQATMIRHVPLVDPCSLCLFPPGDSQAETMCATDSGSAEREERPTGNVDAALPFLSFAAGLMAAAEAVKLQLEGFPFSPNRVTLNTRPAPRLVGASLAYRAGCTCSIRSVNVHRRMIGGSRFASLSG